MTDVTFTFSIVAQIAEVQSEIRMRRKVYARLVSQGKMSPSESSYKIGAMEAVLATLERMRG